MSFLEDFLKGEEMGNKNDAELVNSSGREKTKFKITKVEANEYEFPFGKQSSIVFHVKDSNGKASTLAQSLKKYDGEKYTRIEDMLYPMYWNKTKEEPKPASVIWDLKEAVKETMGEELYEKRKAESKGINGKFFQGVEFEAYLSAGTAKGSGLQYYIINLPSRNKISFWKYLIDQGSAASYNSIKEVRETFKLESDNEQIEPGFDNLPF